MATVVNGTFFVPAFNGTLIDSNLCNVNICSLSYAQLDYVPTKSGNMAYLIIFAILLLAQLVMGPLYRTWGFFVGVVFGLVLEVVGYLGRVALHNDPFSFNDFVTYLVCLTIAPAFISASIYLCLSRLIVVYGQNIARFSPKTYTIFFVSCDIISLLLQAAGGAIAATQDDTNPSDTGVDIMIAGLAFQVVSLTLFIVLALDFAWSARKARESQLNYGFIELRSRTMFRLFPYAIALATLTIFIRCIFRVAELKNGFGGRLANNQVLFMIFEGPMIIIAACALTIFHPGLSFGGSSNWKAANWTWKTKGSKKSNSGADATYTMMDKTGNNGV